METAFIRDNNDLYDQQCDKAHVSLVALVDGVLGTGVVAYLGTAKGKYYPTGCIAWGWLTEDAVWAWVADQGYARKPINPI